MKPNYTTNVTDTQISQKTPKNGNSFNTCTENNTVVRSSEIAQISPLESIGKKPTPCDNQIKRFSLQSHSRDLLPNEAVANCLRLRIDQKRPIDVWKSISFAKAAYGNLQTCKSVWACPVCASKITERRRVELQQGVSNFNGKILLLTLTLQHKINESLQVIVTSLLKAYSDIFTSGKKWTKIIEMFGIVGTIRTLEITYGDNGFHPHLHILLFSNSNDIDVIGLHNILFDRWEHSLNRIGRYTNVKAFNLKYGHENIWEYVTKWGMYLDEGLSSGNWSISHEMTKSVVKRAKKGGYTPFALLESSQNGNEIHGKLFQEYFRYMKGKQQLRYSKGLRELLGIAEKTDEEICNEKIEQSYLFMILSREQWKQILGNDIRAELLQQVANGDIQDVVTFLVKFGIEWDAEQFGYYPDVDLTS